MLIIQLKKQITIQKFKEIEKKVTDHNHNEYITTPEFNKLKLVQADLVTKTNFDNKLSSLNRKIVLNKTRHLLNEKELKKLKTFDLGYFMGRSYFEEDGTQNWLVFQPVQRYFKTFGKISILSRKSKGLSDESIKAPTTSNKMLNPTLNFVGTKARIKFIGDCLKQEKITYSHGKIVIIYIVYEIEKV